VQLKDILNEKRRGNLTKVLFLHENTPAYRALAIQKKFANPPYSPELAPSDYHLLPRLKNTIETSPFFVRRGGQCSRGLSDLLF
jgi:hypothetical protein